MGRKLFIFLLLILFLLTNLFIFKYLDYKYEKEVNLNYGNLAICILECPLDEIIVNDTNSYKSLNPEMLKEKVGGKGIAYKVNDECRDSCINKLLATINPEKYNLFISEKDSLKLMEHFIEIRDCSFIFSLEKSEISSCLSEYL